MLCITANDHLSKYNRGKKFFKNLEISQVVVFFHISYCFLYGSVLCIAW